MSRIGSGWWSVVLLACGAAACGEAPVSTEVADGSQSVATPVTPADVTRTTASSARTERERLENGSYQLRPGSRQELVAMNRQQGLKLSIDSTGLHFSPQDPKKKGAIALAYAGIGRAGEELTGGEPIAPEPGGCEQDARIDEQGECLKRIEYARPGVHEWWENRERGVEQGFTLAQRPAGDGTLLIGVNVVRGRIATLDATGAMLDGGDGFRLKYAQLSARDANGDAVPISLRPGTGQLLLELDDSTATYPVAVDPIIGSIQWEATGGTTSFFGNNAVTVGDVNGDGYGDFAVTSLTYSGTFSKAGRVDVYYGGPSGPDWTSSWNITATQSGMQLGSSVASAGDVNGDGYSDLIVGARYYTNGQSQEGLAQIYLGGPTGLAATPFWSVEGNATSASFGAAVAGAGDINHDGYADVLVGAPGFTNGQSFEGRVTLYYGAATSMSTTPAWTDEGGAANMGYGTAVSAAGDVNGDGFSDFAAGAPYYNGVGAVWVVKGSATGVSGTYQSVAGTTGYQLGKSLAYTDVNGDGYSDLIIGQPEIAATDAGRVQIKMGGPSGFTSTLVETGNPGDAFGAKVAALGDVNGDGYGDVAVGSPSHDGGVTDEGEYQIFLGSDAGLQTYASTWGYGTAASQQCGAGLGTAGDVNGDGYSDFVVGCPWSGGTGKAQLLLGAPTSISSADVWSYAGSTSAYDLGDAMANADVNGDGYSDLIVGARNFDFGPQAGLTYIFNGSVTGLSTTPSTTLTSTSTTGQFGASVANAGDVNGDGYEDVIVGCPYCSNGQSSEGIAYVYLGAAGGVTNTPAWTMESNLAGATFGMAVAGVDVNGDGFSDVAIGAPGYGNVEFSEGAIYVYLGSATGLAATPIAILEPNVAGSELGTSVASAGDVNGDGYGDIITGSPEANSRAGKAWVYLGKSTGINTAASWSYVPAWPGQSYPQFGKRVSSAGDVNGDGYDDVMVAAYDFSGDQINDGRVFVWLGSTTGLNSAVAWISQGNHSGDTVGYAMANVGDLNGDGFGDVATGSPWDSYDDNSSGLISDFLGGPGGLGQGTDSWSYVPGDFVGDNVASAGDVNGDGFGDMVMSAEGRNLYLYYGNTRDGTMPPPGAAAIARRAGLSIPIPPGGKPATRAFDVRLMARSPHGRTRVKVAVEAKPFGTPFDGTGLVKSTTWLDTGLSRVSVTASLTGLTAAKRYHWRARVEYDRSLATDALWSHWYYGGVSGRSLGNHLRMP